MEEITSKHYELIAGINLSKGNIVSLLNVLTIDILTSVRCKDIKKLNAIDTTINSFSIYINEFLLNNDLMNMFKRNIEHSRDYLENSRDFLDWEIMLKKEEEISIITIKLPRKIVSERRKLLVPKILKGTFAIDEEDYNIIINEIK